jgi:Leucine-rich repeat (LRR) protein
MLGSFPNLQSLNFPGASLTNIAFLANLTNLCRLNLGGNERLMDLNALQNLTKLTYLSLANCEAAHRAPLGSLTNLQHLDLSATPVATKTDEIVWQALANLRSLNLSQGRLSAQVKPALAAMQFLTRLNLADSVYADNGVTWKSIAKCTNLIYLNLDYCRDASQNLVTTLQNLRKLKQLEIHYPSGYSVSVQTIQAILPDCTIHTNNMPRHHASNTFDWSSLSSIQLDDDD